jgi:hypothetical protein
MAKSPKSVTIRTYNVGFGDCFLMSFQYIVSSERQVLIDFGSTGFPAGVPNTRMMDIANNIKERTKGKLHAVVATHRHKDHISGFETKQGGKGTGDVVRSLKPNLVVQPWTEDPDLKPNATGPKSSQKQIVRKLGRMGLDTPKHVAALSRMHGIAQQMLNASNLPKVFKGELSFLGETNLANPNAVKNLMTMAKNSYVHCGSSATVEGPLSGVIRTLRSISSLASFASRPGQRNGCLSLDSCQRQISSTSRMGQAGCESLEAFLFCLCRAAQVTEARCQLFEQRLHLCVICRLYGGRFNGRSVVCHFTSPLRSSWRRSVGPA